MNMLYIIYFSNRYPSEIIWFSKSLTKYEDFGFDVNTFDFERFKKKKKN
jgi:hypothetical protein